MEQGRAAQAADGARAGAPVAHADDFADLDRRLVLATQGGLPLVPRPYAAVAGGLGVNEALVRERLAAMLADGTSAASARYPTTTRSATPPTA